MMLSDTAEQMLVLQAQRRPQEFSYLDMAHVMRAADFAWAFFVSIVSEYADPNILTTRPLDNAEIEVLRTRWAPLAYGCDRWQAVVEKLVPIGCVAYQPGRVTFRIEDDAGPAATLVMVGSAGRWVAKSWK